MTKRVTLFVPLTLPLARTLDLPLELEQAADIIIGGHTVHIALPPSTSGRSGPSVPMVNCSPRRRGSLTRVSSGGTLSGWGLFGGNEWRNSDDVLQPTRSARPKRAYRPRAATGVPRRLAALVLLGGRRAGHHGDVYARHSNDRRRHATERANYWSVADGHRRGLANAEPNH